MSIHVTLESQGLSSGGRALTPAFPGTCHARGALLMFVEFHLTLLSQMFSQRKIRMTASSPSGGSCECSNSCQATGGGPSSIVPSLSKELSASGRTLPSPIISAEQGRRGVGEGQASPSQTRKPGHTSKYTQGDRRPCVPSTTRLVCAVLCLVRWGTTNCLARGHIPKSRDVPRNICLGPFPGLLAAGREHLCPSPRGTLPGAPFHRLRPKSLGSSPAPVLPPLACPAGGDGWLQSRESTNNSRPGGKSPAP